MKKKKPFDKNQPLEGNWVKLQNHTDEDEMEAMLNMRERLVTNYPDGIPGHVLTDLILKSKKVHE